MAKSETFRLPYHYFIGKESLQMSEIKEIFKKRFPGYDILVTSGTIYPSTLLFFFKLGHTITIDFHCNQNGTCNIQAFP